MPAASGTITAPAAFTAAPDASLDFEPDTWVFKVTAGTAELSFDGAESHLTLSSTDVILPLPIKRKKLWVRQSGGAATLRWTAISTV